jgi:hypothetical protein
MQPNLVLKGIATGDLIFCYGQQTQPLEPIACHSHLVGRFHLYPKMVQRASRFGIFD